jgi:amidase
VSTPSSGTPFVPHDLKAPLAGAAAGPLAGLTVAVKDMYDIAGERTGGGSPEWLAAHEPAAKTAPIVERLLDAGATIIGKTICDEFFFSVTGANAHYGTPLNPRAPGRLPGGSSSGSAAAVAAGACDAALGSDTGGSVRIPAALCGLYGIRPTHGRVDLSGAMAMAPSFDVAGWFTAGPGLLRKLGQALLDGPAERAPLTRLLLPTDAFAEADAPVAAALRRFLDRAAPALPRAEEIVLAPGGFDEWRNSFRTIQGREVWDVYGDWLERHRPTLGPGIRERLAYSATVSAADAEAARGVMAAARRQLRSVLTPGTVVCLPTAPCIAPPVDTPSAGLDSYRSRVMALTVASGLGGLPQVSLPAALVDGCPVGLSLLGSVGADEALLDLAVALGRYCGA